MGKFALPCDEWLARGVGLLVGLALGVAVLAIGAQAWGQDAPSTSSPTDTLNLAINAILTVVSLLGGAGLERVRASRLQQVQPQPEVVVVQLGDRDYGEMKGMRRSLHIQGNAHTKTHGILFAIADHLGVQVDETAVDADSDEPEVKS